jgi:hypothetical protein
MLYQQLPVPHAGLPQRAALPAGRLCRHLHRLPAMLLLAVALLPARVSRLMRCDLALHGHV